MNWRLTGPPSGTDPRTGDYDPGIVHDTCGETALHLAIQANKPKLVRALVKAGADLNIPLRRANKKVLYDLPE